MNRFLLAILVVTVSACAATHDYEVSRTYYTRSQASISVTEKVQEIELKKGIQGRLYLPAKIGNSEILLMVDSGATMTVIERELLQREGIEIMEAPKGVFWGAGGAVKAGVARVPLLNFGGWGLQDCPVVAADLEEWNQREAAAQGITIQGILGSAHLELIGATINYASHTLTIDAQPVAAGNVR